MSELPNEIQFAIMEALGRPVFPDAYRLDVHSVATLATMARVSRSFQEVAEPILYSRCFITPTCLASFSRAVIVREEKRAEDSVRYTKSRRGGMIKSLAFAHFNDELTMNQTNDLARILLVGVDTLERLFWDVYLRRVDYSSPLIENPLTSLKQAMHGLRNLIEFIATQHLPWQLDPMPWSSAVTLKRLASVNTNLHYKLADTIFQMPNLEAVVCCYPSLMGTQVVGTPFSRLIKSGNEALKEIIIILPDKGALDFRRQAAMKLIGEVMESEDARADDARRGLLTIANGPVEWNGRFELTVESGSPWEAWFLEAVSSGRLWNIERQEWDHCMDFFS